MAGIPVYSIKTASASNLVRCGALVWAGIRQRRTSHRLPSSPPSHLTPLCPHRLRPCRAVRTLLGIDPSPGAMFAGDAELPAAADPRSRTSTSRTLRAEASIALAAAAEAGSITSITSSSSSGGANAQDALEEARLAGGV